MAANLIWRPQAPNDLLLIYEFIGRDNPTAAERLFRSIEYKVTLLIDHPRLGPRRPHLRYGARILLEEPYLILYETYPDTDDGPIDEIEIVRVVDSRRDLTRPF
jgi:toxin ParE1/3/4